MALDPLGDSRLAPLLPTLVKAQPRGGTATAAETVAPSDTFRPGETRAATGSEYPWESNPSPAAVPLAMQLPDPEEALPSLAEARARDKELGVELRDLRARRKELRNGPLAEAAEVHRNFLDTTESREHLKAQIRMAQWQRAGGEELSPTLRSYFVHGQTPVSEMQEVARITRNMDELKLAGNRVDPLTREEIWQKKMRLLDGAARNPQGLEVEAQYYEMASPDMLDKLARTARGGANVRVMLDPGTLQKGQDGELDATSLATRYNAMRRLEVGSQGQAGLQFFANKDVLGARTEIMHRKLLRVGDEVVFGGMNSGSGSGDNVDFAVSMQGPAATRLSQGFQRDMELSRNKSVAEIYGTQLDELRSQENVVVNRRGALELLESQTGLAPRGGLTLAERVDRVMESAGFQGVRASGLMEIPDQDGDGRVGPADERAFLLEGSGTVRLTESGRHTLADGLTGLVDRMNSPSNQQRLDRSNPPSDRPQGADTVAVGDSSTERQALVLHAIDSADKFIKVSAFVLNEDLARLLAEKKERMGPDFQVQVVMDPGFYSFGSTPNEKAFKLLEDRGVDVRWAVLDRTDPEHDRKVHAKLIVTDKMMLTGSTNFSHKGLRDNWEASEVVFFNDSEQSRGQMSEVVGDFDRLWERETMPLDTRALAERKYGDRTGAEGDYLRDTHRTRVTRSFLRGIRDYEQQVGERVEDRLAGDPALQLAVGQRMQAGQSRGYAIMEALGEEQMQALRQSSPQYQRLLAIQAGTA